jgi:putative salt-induced outer membrane protein YdiY
MCPRRRILRTQLIRLAVILACALPGFSRAENVVLYLKSGDKITGFVVSEYTNRLVLSNSWVKELSVPLTEIQRREITLAGGTNRVARTNLSAKLKAQVSPAAPPKLFKHWKGEAEVGLDLTYSTSDQQMYHGRFNLSYELPYKSDPKKFFRNTIDYSLQYGKIEQTVNGVRQTVASADKMGGSDKTSFDITRRWYAYNIAGAGNDRIQNITVRGEEGPGMGYHWITQTNLAVNLEAGVDYQIQYNTDNTHSRDLFYRVAEDINWKINDRTTFTEKMEFFPRINFEEYRFRAEATLSYNLWRYIYLNMTVRDTYDTKPVAGAQPSELDLHSALGVKF